MAPYGIVFLVGIILVTASATPLPPDAPFVTSWTTDKVLSSFADVAHHVILPKEATSETSVALIHSEGMGDDRSSHALALLLKTGKKLWKKGPKITSAVQFNGSTVLLEYGPVNGWDDKQKGFSIVDAMTGEILLSHQLVYYNDSSVVHLSSSDSIYLIRGNGYEYYSGPSKDETINTILRLSGPSYDPESPAASVTWKGRLVRVSGVV